MARSPRWPRPSGQDGRQTYGEHHHPLTGRLAHALTRETSGAHGAGSPPGRRPRQDDRTSVRRSTRGADAGQRRGRTHPGAARAARTVARQHVTCRWSRPHPSGTVGAQARRCTHLATRFPPSGGGKQRGERQSRPAEEGSRSWTGGWSTGVEQRDGRQSLGAVERSAAPGRGDPALEAGEKRADGRNAGSAVEAQQAVRTGHGERG